MERHPLNVPGDFYVVNGGCIICMAPEYCAPTLMGFFAGPEGTSHCYFKKQPSTPEETSKAVYAVLSTCCDALRYEGKDPAILEQLPSHLCDHSSEGKSQ